MSEEGRRLIQRAHLDFLKAGSDVISTVTYQCHYEKSVLDDDDSLGIVNETRMDAMLRDGVRLAREAVKEFQDAENDVHVSTLTSRRNTRQCYVAASIGCYGASLADGSEYTGNYNGHLTSIINELCEFHRRKYYVLLGEMPDCIAFETIPCMDECSAILKMLKDSKCNEPSWSGDLKQREVLAVSSPAVWISFACQDGQHLNDGHLLTDALDMIYSQDPEANLVHAVGVNCCACMHGTYYVLHSRQYFRISL